MAADAGEFNFPNSPIVLNQHSRSHIFNHGGGKFAGLYFCGAGHQALEVIRHLLLVDRPLHALFDQIGRFVPAQVAEHHDP